MAFVSVAARKFTGDRGEFVSECAGAQNSLLVTRPLATSAMLWLYPITQGDGGENVIKGSGRVAVVGRAGRCRTVFLAGPQYL